MNGISFMFYGKGISSSSLKEEISKDYAKLKEKVTDRVHRELPGFAYRLTREEAMAM